MTDLIGKSLGPYQIVGEIGRGGMAVVYEAYHPVLARRVAIKVLLPHFAADAALVRRFLQEARSAANLTHPNIVTIYDVVEQGGQYYIVMQRLPGLPLNQLIRQAGVLPLPRAAAITSQIASALDYAHRNKIVHRDVKPANIIVGPDDHAVLTDFGVARAAEAGSLTSFGTVIGTPEYMSPEQAKGETVGPASDLYSLGIVVYEMLSGGVPFRAPNTPALLFKQVYDPPPPVRTHVPELAEGVDGVLVRALAKEPAQRFATGGEFAQALQDLATTRSVAPPVKTPRPIATPAMDETRLLRPAAPAAVGPRSSPPRPITAPWNLPGWLLPAMGVIIAALLVAVIALWPRSSLPPPTPSPRATAIVPASATPAVALVVPATSTLVATSGEVRPTATLFRPPTADVIATSTATPVVATGTPTLPPMTLPASTERAPTVTLAPMLMATRPPATPTRSAAPPPPTAVQRGRTLPPPIPQQPNGQEQAGPQIVFQWSAGAHSLTAHEGYAVLVWSPAKNGDGSAQDLSLPSPSDFCGQRWTDTSFFMAADILQQRAWAGAGAYHWTVVIVDTSQKDASGRCVVVSEWGRVLSFKYEPPSGGGGGQCQPPSGGCPPKTTWDQETCECKQ